MPPQGFATVPPLRWPIRFWICNEDRLRRRRRWASSGALDQRMDVTRPDRRVRKSIQPIVDGAPVCLAEQQLFYS